MPDGQPHPHCCTGTTAKGAACKAAPLKGTDRCAAHPLSPGSARFGSPEQARAAGALGGRPRVPRATELQRELVERHAVALVRPYFKTLGLELHEDGSATPCSPATRYVWAGVEEPAVKMEDLGAQIHAAERLQDRVFGKPRQAVEVTGENGGPIELEEIAGGMDLSKLSDEQLTQLQELIARAAPGE